jgi:SAM-dependent methyltransferase
VSDVSNSASTQRFGGHYDTWTDNRVRWILENFGERVFEGKTVLDIGGGTGHIARRVRELGARRVEVVEGRLTNIAESVQDDAILFTLANLERGLTTREPSYDIVLNFGTIYHLANWEPVLIDSILRAGELVFIETEVIDSEVEYNRYVVENMDGYDQAMSGVGSRPSEFEIDRLLARVPNALGRKVLDSALNAEFHRYDWENTLDGNVEDGLRRFWAVRRLTQLDAVGERAAAEALLREIHYSKTLETLVLTRRAQHELERKLDAVLELLTAAGSWAPRAAA